MDELRAHVDAGGEFTLDFRSPHEAAALLKMFLRQLPEHILTDNMAPVFEKIAARHGVAASAAALAFLMAEGHIVIPASSNEGHLRDNFRATEVNLSAEEMSEIRTLERGLRVINPSISPVWDD